jgi:hypothetical protein
MSCFAAPLSPAYPRMAPGGSVMHDAPFHSPRTYSSGCLQKEFVNSD